LKAPAGTGAFLFINRPNLFENILSYLNQFLPDDLYKFIPLPSFVALIKQLSRAE